MTKQFTHFQSIVNYRIEIKPDGSLGSPEILAKWTKESNAPKYKAPKPKPKAKPKTIISKATINEVEY